MGVKQIALMVAGIVVIGAVVLIFTTTDILQGAIRQIWDGMWGWIEEIFEIGWN